MKRTIQYLMLIAVLSVAAFASAETISWVRVSTSGGEGYDQLRADVNLDVLTEWRGDYIDIVAEESSIDHLRDEGYTVEYLMYDIYDPVHYEGKGYSGYTDYSEMMTRLNALATNYPSIVALTNLGTCTQGTHDVWLLKISDGVGSDDPDKPDAMLTGVHHAREPMSLEVPLYFAEQLCAEYGSDPDVTDIVDNMELYVIPLLNPEGYTYDDVEGSRNWWRKNSYDWPNPNYPTDMGGGEGTGVDLNRNYSYHWGNGSQWYEQTYCGVSAFSEPEASMIEDLCIDHTNSGNPFTGAFHYHSYGRIFLRPYSWNQTDPPPDDLAIFDEIYEGYRDAVYDQSGIWIDYSVGGSIGSAYDYMYAEHGTFAYTVELNSYSEGGFYPDESKISPTCARHYDGLMWWCEYIIDNFGSTGIDDGEDGPATPSAFELLSVYPNPVSDTASFSFALPESAEVNVGLFDIRGRKVSEITEERPEGENTLSMNVNSLSDGLYLYEVAVGEERAVGKLVVK